MHAELRRRSKIAWEKTVQKDSERLSVTKELATFGKEYPDPTPRSKRDKGWLIMTQVNMNFGVQWIMDILEF